MQIRKLDREQLKYALGAVMYCPADNQGIAKKIISGSLSYVSTVVFCLEDAIMPQHLNEATDILEDTLRTIASRTKDMDSLPLIFIRIRNPWHLEDVYVRFCGFSHLITGFVLPKYDTTVSHNYTRVIHKINTCYKFLYLPILESENIIAGNRIYEMEQIKKSLDAQKSVLGILVGGNDICKYFGIRRNCMQNIYQIGAVANVLYDIIRVFGPDYIINGPVWEFFDGDCWDKGLKQEIEMDKLNGFVGKACIHPKQAELINEELKVCAYDYEDASDLICWDTGSGVKKSRHSGRMNEIATNLSWAEKTKMLGDIYGIKSL